MEQIELQTGDGSLYTALTSISAERISTVRSRNLQADQDAWEELTREALQNPIGTPALELIGLAGKRIVVMVDDWYRPTPASRVLPSVLAALHRAGASVENIDIMVSGGAHDPMKPEDVVRKVGQDAYDRYRCHVHDGFGDHAVAYGGTTPNGTPIFINHIVLGADFRIAIGRVAPHPAAGYEGSGKMIAPGCAHWSTVMRLHGGDLSPQSAWLSYENNPVQHEVQAISKIVGLHHIVNFVVDGNDRPLKGFAGDYRAAHRAAIAWGDANQWSAEIGTRADITIAAAGPSDHAPSGKGDWAGGWLRHGRDLHLISRAAMATKPGGTAIFITDDPEQSLQTASGSSLAPSIERLLREIEGWTYDQLLLARERRGWQTPEEIVQYSRALHREIYLRRPGRHCELVQVGAPLREVIGKSRKIRACESLQRAVDEATERHGQDARIVVLPRARTTFPLERFHAPEVL